MNILVFDIHITGHHSEYISHFVDYLVTNKSKDNYYFIVHPSFCEKFPEIVATAHKVDYIHIVPIAQYAFLKMDSVNRIKRSINYFKLMNFYSIQYKVHLCYLLHMNVFQIALGLYKVPYKIRGILFMQFTNMKISSVKDYYYYLRRYFPMLLCIRNQKLDSVFLLNDSDSAVLLNDKFKKEAVFKYLPDPVPFVVSEKDFDLRTFYGIDKERKIFLHFGSLSERKGTLDILDSVYFLQENQKTTTIVLAGKATDAFDAVLSEKISKIRKVTDVQVVWDNSFISNERVVALFNQCDAVLIPYKNAEASSGVLGHAIHSGKKVIGPSNGLIGKLIKNNDLGVCIDSINPEKIASALFSKFLDEKSAINSAYLEEHKPTNFIKTLLCT
jgi:glycosyltransferase involved in cell wall biosynthesis